MVQVAALSTKAVQDSGAGVELNAGGSTVVRLPASVVYQAAKRSGPEASNNSLLFVSITDIQAKVANKLADARNEGELTSAVASQTVSVTLRREDGSALDVGRLGEPIELEILVGDTNASCAFWDERQATWSFEGLRTIPADTSGRIICQTSHLTIFAGVLQSIWENSLQVIVCSSAGTLLTAEGFQRLFRSGWPHSLPAISTLVFVALFLLVFCRALQVDWQTQKAVPWRVVEPVLLRVKETSEDDNSDDKVPAAHRARACCCQKLACMKDWCLWFAGICFNVEHIVQIVAELLPNAPEATVNRCIKSLHAHRSGVAKDSLALILKPGEKFKVQDTGLGFAHPKLSSLRRQQQYASLYFTSFTGEHRMIDIHVPPGSSSLSLHGTPFIPARPQEQALGTKVASGTCFWLVSTFLTVLQAAFCVCSRSHVDFNVLLCIHTICMRVYRSVQSTDI